MNQKFEELKEQWRVEKAALALAGVQDEIKEVGACCDRGLTFFFFRLRCFLNDDDGGREPS